MIFNAFHGLTSKKTTPKTSGCSVVPGVLERFFFPRKAKLETMTLDKKRQIDSNAAVLGCPVDLRNYIFKQIEKEIKQNNNAAKAWVT